MAAKISNWLGTRSQRSHLSAALCITIVPISHLTGVETAGRRTKVKVHKQYMVFCLPQCNVAAGYRTVLRVRLRWDLKLPHLPPVTGVGTAGSWPERRDAGLCYNL